MDSTTTQDLMPVVIYEDSWGSDYLLNTVGKGKTHCCLGFACLALGHTEEDIRHESFPHAVDEYRFNDIASTEFQMHFERLIPDRERSDTETSLAQLLAIVNDYYHRCTRFEENGYEKPRLARTLVLIRMGFREVGLDMVFVPKGKRLSDVRPDLEEPDYAPVHS